MLLLVIVVILCATIFIEYRRRSSSASLQSKHRQANELEQNMTEIKKPISVNYHFSRVCNYKCGFCFHTNTNDFKLPLGNYLVSNISALIAFIQKPHRQALKSYTKQGWRRSILQVRISEQLLCANTNDFGELGGEPFLHPDDLGNMCKFSKVNKALRLRTDFDRLSCRNLVWPLVSCPMGAR